MNVSKFNQHGQGGRAFHPASQFRRHSRSPKVSGKVRAIRTIWTFLCLAACSFHSFQVTSLYFQWQINAEAFFFPTDPIIPPMATVCLLPSPFRTPCPEPLTNGACLPFLSTPQKFFDASYKFEELIKRLVLVNSEKIQENHSGQSLLQFKSSYVKTYKWAGSVCFSIDYLASLKKKSYRQVDIQAMTIPVVLQLWFNITPPVMVLVTLGTRKDIPSKLTGGTVQFAKMNNSLMYYFTYRKKELTLLKAPYATNCRDYASEGVHGVTTREKCIRNCDVKKTMAVNGGKIPFETPVFQNHSKTNDDRRLETKESKPAFRDYCESQCVLIECDMDEYVAWRNLESEVGTGQGPAILLQLPSEADLKVIYKPKMTFWEYSTLFGSVFGLWFGLSVFNCERLVEKLIMRWKKKTQMKVAS